ncbi:MAG: Nitrogenase molybdenum-iron protein beta chain [Bacteroidetes bacterium ADurb.Bin217]|nr:MAG: Nitrogenase molybdenum-iron protein beta chain [Bacteroidetes bacterium ADurb.Bin217]
MLLRHTTDKIIDREALTVNPAKTCQPVGAMYAVLGIHGCLPHSHGSQGCCSYHRSALTRHYKEPVMAATSSFTEGSSVFGGQANLVQAIDTMFAVYNPDVVAVHSTCLSETIGDDLTQIIAKAKEEGHVPAGKYVFHANTPSYVGSHVTGYANMVTAMVKSFSMKSATKKNQVNIISGWVEPSDMREIKRIASEMMAKIVLFPDTSDVLDAPMTGKHEFYPKGGVTVPELISTGDSKFTIGLGPLCTLDACIKLENQCKVKFESLELPIGIQATDAFITALSRAAGVQVPDSLTEDRGRLIDVIADMQKYLYGKRVALFGDPDTLVPLTEFLIALDMKPVYIVTGTPDKTFDARMSSILSAKVPEAKFKAGERADIFLLHQWIKQQGVDLLIGNTYGKYVARDENIPFVRLGFPILDRVGHSYFPMVGYAGAMNLVTKILDVIMDKIDREVPEEKVELVM